MKKPERPTKRRILFVNENLAVGGTERALINIVNSIDGKSFDVDLLLVQPELDLLEDVRPGVNVLLKDVTRSYGSILNVVKQFLFKGRWFELCLRIGAKLPDVLGALLFRTLSGQFKLGKRYDIAVAFRPGISEDIVQNCAKAIIKITWWHHGCINTEAYRDKLRRSWDRFDKVVTVSEGISYYLQKELPEIKDKIEVVYNMINPEEIIHKSEDINPYKCSDSTFKLLTVSRLQPEKNLPRIIDIALELKRRQIRFVWIILGDGPIYDSMKDLIDRNGLNGCIDLHGTSINPYIWMRYADLMVHPSLVESFGLVLIEAMALGTPCVAGKSLGAKDIVNKDNGLLVDDNPVDYASAISRLYDNPRLLASLSSRTLHSIDKYTSGRVIDKFYSLLAK